MDRSTMLRRLPAFIMLIAVMLWVTWWEETWFTAYLAAMMFLISLSGARNDMLPRREARREIARYAVSIIAIFVLAAMDPPRWMMGVVYLGATLLHWATAWQRGRTDAPARALHAPHRG